MSAFGQGERCRPTELRVEYERNPANLEPTRPPRFSWRVDTDRRGARQTAYRVAVSRRRDTAASGRGTFWDSGRVESTAATNVDETYYWSVKIWADAGESEWADPSSFSTASARSRTTATMSSSRSARATTSSRFGDGRRNRRK